MKKAILLEAEGHIADFLFHLFPALSEEEEILLYRAMCHILRGVISAVEREVKREEGRKRIDMAAERSRN
jgi:hypothetical protein